MRTTLTLDADVVELLEAERARRRVTFKEVVNDALRRGLAPQGRPAAPPYRVAPHVTTLRPGIDPRSMNSLSAELEDEAVLERWVVSSDGAQGGPRDSGVEVEGAASKRGAVKVWSVADRIDQAQRAPRGRSRTGKGRRR